MSKSSLASIRGAQAEMSTAPVKPSRGRPTDTPSIAKVHSADPETPLADAQEAHVSHPRRGANENIPPDHPISHSRARHDAGDPGKYAHLRLLADTYLDLQKSRIAVGNRIGASVIDAELVAGIAKLSAQQEELVRKAMVFEFRSAVPHVAEWAKAQIGIGKTRPTLVSALIGAIGSPSLAQPYTWEGEGKDRKLIALEPYDRTLRQFWQYCGYGDPSAQRRKGMSAQDAMWLGNPRAKTLLRLMAEKCVIYSNPDYRPVYDKVKARYLERGLTPGHAQACAYRAMAKEILRDLWLVDRQHRGLAV